MLKFRCRFKVSIRTNIAKTKCVDIDIELIMTHNGDQWGGVKTSGTEISYSRKAGNFTTSSVTELMTLFSHQEIDFCNWHKSLQHLFCFLIFSSNPFYVGMLSGRKRRTVTQRIYYFIIIILDSCYTWPLEVFGWTVYTNLPFHHWRQNFVPFPLIHLFS